MRSHHAGWRALSAALATAALAVALAVPSVALAASATFSYKTPGSGSSSLTKTPKISVYVVDKYGVKSAANFTMTVDGRAVKPKITYKKSGDYKRVTLSFQVTSPLAPGSHTYVVKVKNIRRQLSSTSWKSTVLAPPPPPSAAEMPIAGTACSDCHAGYPAAHPMTTCVACHGSAAPPRPGGGVMTAYGPSDSSAHTVSCLVSPCHRGGGIFPHALDSDCSRCHTGAYPGIPAVHSQPLATYHVSTSTFCTRAGCHLASLTKEHYDGTYRRRAGGAPLTCATCHASSDPKVRAAIDGKSTACESCHDPVAVAHPNAVSDHASPAVSCTVAGCHAGPVTAIHANTVSGCASCHGAGAAVTAVCLTCHATGHYHVRLPAAHTIAPISCTGAGCHPGGTDVSAIHATQGCATCHSAGKAPTLVCATPGCHTTDATASHQSHPTTISSGTMYILGASYGTHLCAECHPTMELQAVHGGASSCSKCHPSPRTGLGVWNKTCVQGDCHKAGTALAMHGSIDASHTLVARPTCIAADCHTGGTDVAKIHAAQGCATCHSPGKTATLVCATTGCHGATDTHPASNPHPKMTAGHTTGLSATCVKPGCHAADLVALHAPALRCATCHAPGAATTKDCSSATCHPHPVDSTDLHPTYASGHLAATGGCVATGCHAANVIALHAAGATPPGCAACHAAGKPALTTVCATVGCHATGAPPSHAGHPATVSSGLITILGTSYGSHLCSECHATTELQAAHGGTSSCAKCHPSPRSSFTVWNKTCVQGDCHKTGTTLAMHGSLDSAHTAGAQSCTVAGCHAGGGDVAKIHAAQGCVTCHAAGRTATLLCATVGCHATGASGTHASHPATITSGTITILGTSYGKHLCSECHATTELQAAHGGTSSCAKCHPSPRSSFTVWNKTCVQGDCHKAGTTLAMHGSLDASHTVATPTCTVAGCHSGGTDVAKIHAVQGCAVCHTTGRKATLVCATVGCHATGTAGTHDSHPSTVTSGTITILGVSYGTHLCSECHASTELQAAHGGKSSCAKCHPSPRSSFTVWNKTCVQGSCHKSGAPLAMHGSLDASHTLSAKPSCVAADCHTGGTDAAAIHGVAGGPGCAACHGAGKTTTLVCATAGCHGAADTHPAANPHPTMTASHTTTLSAACVKSGCHAADLVALHAPALRCATCHGAGKTTTKDCAVAGCHPQAVGSTTLHPTYVSGHNALPAPSCILAGCHTGGTDVIAIHATQGCGACHAAGKPALTTVCTTSGCHAGGAPATHGSHPATITGAPFSILGASYGTHLCSECHPTTELQALHGGKTGCSKCHPTPRSSFTVWNKGCVQGDCHKSGTALGMHGAIDASHTLTAVPSCVATDCHTGGTSAAAIHGVTGGPGCAACHGAGKVLTLACATSGCHGGSDPHPAVNPHPTMLAGHTTGLSVTCVKTGCHAADLGALHRPGLGCATCHGAGKTPTKDCATTGCHLNNPYSTVLHPTVLTAHALTPTPSCVATDCHTGTRATTIHSKQGCVVCHNGAALTTVCATPGCHSNTDQHPAANPHPAMTAGHTTGLSATCVTGGCHAADLAALHAPALGCATCHATGKTPGKECAATGCHPYPVTSTTLHPTYVTAHALAVAPSCVGTLCHAGGADAAAIHTAGTTPPGCAACHAAGKPALTTTCSTPGCHDTGLAALHPSAGHTVNAHPCTGAACHGTSAPAIHEQTATGCGVCHDGGPATTNACSDCHPTSWASRHAVYAVTSDYHGAKVGYGSSDWGWYSTGWILAPYTRGMSMPCATCHVQAGTTNLYDFPLVVNGRPVTVTSGYQMANMCYACHGGTIDDWHAGCFGCHAGGMGTGGLPTTMVGRDCSACHQHGMPSWPHGRFSMTGATL